MIGRQERTSARQFDELQQLTISAGASTGGCEDQPVVKNSAKSLATGFLLAGTAFGSVCAANDCKTIDREEAIAGLVAQHEGSKVLKVEESLDPQGCVELKVRILIDGTVKAITIPNETGA